MKKILQLSFAMLALVSTGFSQATMSIQPSTACWYPQSPTNVTVSVSSATTATSYSWSSQGSCTNILVSSSGSVAVFQLQCCGMHTVTCQVYNGSTLCCTATGTVMAVCPPTVIALPSTSITCPGESATIAAVGAATYTWNTGTITSQIVVSPSVATCYSVIGSNAQGCTDTTSYCILVGTAPTISITNASPLICQGTAVTLSAWGGMSYSWSPGALPSGPSAASIILFPQSNTCYSVAGSNGTCIGYASSCVSVIPQPVLYNGPVQNVCLGSSITLSANPAVSYTWGTTPPVNTQTIKVQPAATTAYTVSGTGSNGCIGGSVVLVLTNSLCADVWPGDANSDGVVNSSDVIELGLFANAAGPARSPGGNSWSSQYAMAWNGMGSNSQNRSHVDCNGDGAVNASDTLAIFNNFSLTHTFRIGNSQVGDDMWLSGPSYIPTNSGNWHKVDIGMGSATNTIQNIFGVSFDLHYQSSYVDNHQVYILYPPSFLDAGNSNLPFRRVDGGSSLVNCVSVRTDGNTVSGQGKIGEFWFYSKALSSAGTMTVTIDNVIVYDNSGNPTSLTGAAASIPAGPVSLQEFEYAYFGVFPNPADNELTIRSGSATQTNYVISDLTGRIIGMGDFAGETRLDISSFAAGTYLIAIKAGEMNVSKRFVKQ